MRPPFLSKQKMDEKWIERKTIFKCKTINYSNLIQRNNLGNIIFISSFMLNALLLDSHFQLFVYTRSRYILLI